MIRNLLTNMLLIVILINILYFGIAEKYLYDLSSDPTESTNLFFKTYYYSTVQSLEKKITQWSLLLNQADNYGSSQTVSQLEVWKGCNCVHPWIEDETTAREIEQIYQPSNPPHIVFVLADDLGWNDIGYQSTYQSWATPAIDLLASEGIKLKFYFTHDSCTPSRGALLTGRYSIRLGLHEDSFTGAELPITEATLAEELKSAGYRTNMVGKWHLGSSSELKLPHNRGFDYTYGYYNGYIDYWSKKFNGYTDLHENGELVTDDDELSSDIHSAYLFQSKVENVISDHVENYPDQPMFLYYSLQLVHFPYEPPAEFVSRCQSSDITTTKFCGQTLMLDEVIANLTCALKSNNMIDNTILIFASDNGGTAELNDNVVGNSVPFRGHKFSFNRGGISAPAFIHSPLIPESARGSEYNGLMHVTDWLPTLMGLATEGAWSGSYIDNAIDGVDMWDAIITGSDSPKQEIVNYISESGLYASYQYGNYKYDKNLDLQAFDEVEYSTTRYSKEYEYSCSAISLMNEDEFSLPFFSKWHFVNHVYKHVKQSRLDKFASKFASFHWTTLASILAIIGISFTGIIYIINRKNDDKDKIEQEVPLVSKDNNNELDPLIS